jgi:putative resolvase
MLLNKFLSIGQTAELFGVAVVTIRRWCKSGKLISTRRTFGGHRRFSLAYLRELLGEKVPDKVMGYARVSSHDQKKDLVTQANVLRDAGCHEVITDLGSGMNCKKPGLTKLLKAIISGELTGLMITHHDRLLRFGHELIFKLCQWFSVKVIILHNKVDKSFEMELTEDVITLMTVFSARLYGKRSHQNRQRRKLEAEKVLIA